MKPKIHLTPACNWMNDPVGLIYFQNHYHAFYQYFPYETKWGTMHWGHAVSEDLTHWQQMPIALYPSRYEDCNGCFSGSAVENEGKMCLFYTGIRYDEPKKEDIHRGEKGLFTACQMGMVSEDGFHFNNQEKTVLIPVLKDKKIGSDRNTRDPKVWKDSTGWHMILGSQCEYQGELVGELLLYESADGKTWRLQKQHLMPGEHMPECPDLFRVDDQWVLFVSLMESGQGQEPRDHSFGGIVNFHPDTGELYMDTKKFALLDEGKDIYAAQTFRDARGRTVMMAWVRMPQVFEGESWINMLTMPRVVSLEEGQLRYAVHPAIRNQFSIPCQEVCLQEAPIRIEADLEEGGEMDLGGFLIRREGQELYTDRSKVYKVDQECWARKTQTKLSQDRCHLEIYVDHGVLELFINGGKTVITQVVYALGNKAQWNKVKNLRCWKM